MNADAVLWVLHKYFPAIEQGVTLFDEEFPEELPVPLDADWVSHPELMDVHEL